MNHCCRFPKCSLSSLHCHCRRHTVPTPHFSRAKFNDSEHPNVAGPELRWKTKACAEPPASEFSASAFSEKGAVMGRLCVSSMKVATPPPPTPKTWSVYERRPEDIGHTPGLFISSGGAIHSIVLASVHVLLCFQQACCASMDSGYGGVSVRENKGFLSKAHR